MPANISREPDYSDIDLNFQINPITGDLNKLSGQAAIKRSIRNLIYTNYYERPFKSYLGSDVPRLLFDNVDPMTGIFIEDAIKTLINNHEPRVRLVGVKAQADIDNHGFKITIAFVIVNRELPATINLFLRKIR